MPRLLLDEFLQDLRPQEVESFQRMLDHPGWRIFSQALEALEETVKEAAISAGSGEEGLSKLQLVKAIRQVSGLREHILKRGAIHHDEARRAKEEGRPELEPGWFGAEQQGI